MKSHARVVIVGGGAMGVGLLYHLTKEGWTDVVLVEKGELTSGSTWHAAGLIPHFIGSLNMAKVHRHGIELYKTLEQETGQATGWHGCGAIRIAGVEDSVHLRLCEGRHLSPAGARPSRRIVDRALQK